MSPGNRFSASSALHYSTKTRTKKLFIHGGSTKFGPMSDTWRLDPPTRLNKEWKWTEIEYKGTVLP